MTEQDKRDAVLEWLNDKLTDLYNQRRRAKKGGEWLYRGKFDDEIELLEGYRRQFVEDYVPVDKERVNEIRRRLAAWSYKVTGYDPRA